MQSLTWLFSTPHADNPRFVDDWLRCSTLPRPCTVSETLRRCTYEPKGTWYRERRAALTPRWIGRTARTTSGSCTNTARTRRDKSGCATLAWRETEARSSGVDDSSFSDNRRRTRDRGRFTDEACAHGDGIRYVHDGVVVGERRWIRIRVSTAPIRATLYVWEYFARSGDAFFDSRRLLRRFDSTTSRERATTRIVSSFHSAPNERVHAARRVPATTRLR